jgi:hypothetical protein
MREAAMLDRLREGAMDDEFDEEDAADLIKEVAAEEDLIFGLNPAQRLVLSMFLFLDVTVLGCMLLMALERINIW